MTDAPPSAGDKLSELSQSMMDRPIMLSLLSIKGLKRILDNISFAANSTRKQIIKIIEEEREEALFRFKNLTFENGSARLDANSGQEIDNVAAILKVYPDVKVEVQGHTDNANNADKDLNLSAPRAQSVKASLFAQGIAGSRIGSGGCGQTGPIAKNSIKEGRAQNRKIEIKNVN